MDRFSFLTALDAKVCFDYPSLSAFKCGGNIGAVIFPEDRWELLQAVDLLKRAGEDYKVIANGTNVLIRDEGIFGAVICTKYLCGIDVEDDMWHVGAGEGIVKLAQLAANSGFSGLEGLCSIPGTVGGGVAMNCSAFGRQIADLVEYVDILTEDGIERLKASELAFSYRTSLVKNKGIAVGAGIRLVEGDKYAIAKDMLAYRIARQKSQPSGISLGSTFKRAGDVSAGYYIDKAGLKGYKIGGAQISFKHANFIINTGGAKADDFLQVAEYARQEVDKLFGVRLQYEIDVL